MANLLSLPVELRQEIYINLFTWPDKNIPEKYISQAISKGLYCGVCRIGFRKDRYRGNKDGCPASIYRPQASTNRSLAMLQTCRRLYFEATDMIYNNTLFLVTNQYTSESYSYQSCNWRQRTQWTSIGTVDDCEFMKRMDNVVVEQFLPTGRDGLALGPKLRLLGCFLKRCLGSERRSIEVLLRFETNQLRVTTQEGEEIMHQLWKDLARLLGRIEFGCRPRLMIDNSVKSTPGVSNHTSLSKWKQGFEEMLEGAGVSYDGLEVRAIR